MTAVRRRAVRARRGGFTLIELMVAIAVLAILVALAVPNFNDATLSARLNGFANSLVASRAGGPQRGDQAQRDDQACAILRRRNRDLRRRRSGKQGWIVLTDDDSVLQRQQALPTEFRVTEGGGADDLAFPARSSARRRRR